MSGDLFYNYASARQNQVRLEEELHQATEEAYILTNQVRIIARQLAELVFGVNDEGEINDGVVHFYHDICIIALSNQVYLLPIFTKNWNELEIMLFEANAEAKTRKEAEPKPKPLSDDEVPF